MAAVPAKERKLLRATYLIRNVLTKPGALSKHLLEPFEGILTAKDQSFLNKFLENNDLKNILALIDVITRLTQNAPASSNNKIITNLRPLISKLRPEKSEDRNCLIALNDTWNEIEGLLTKSSGKQNSDAQELYDILSDEFVRNCLETKRRIVYAEEPVLPKLGNSYLHAVYTWLYSLSNALG
ncbi:hypothetical protein ACTXT7_013533 [Hymenolepis weldensis]